MSTKKRLVLVMAVLVLIAGTLAALIWRNGQPHSCDIPFPGAEAVSLGDDICVTLEKASTPEQRQRGLSGRQRLLATEGMLFEFDRPEAACMWMKDMHFSLDMVWLDSQQRIIKIAKQVAPETYPQSFCADSPAAYVLELAAGTADMAALQLGQQLRL